MPNNDDEHLTGTPEGALLEEITNDMQLSMLDEVPPMTAYVAPSPLSPNTPEQKLLFQELRVVYRSLQRIPPRRFATPHQQIALQQAAEALGDNYADMLRMALEAGRTSMAGVLRYLQACVRSQSAVVGTEDAPVAIETPWRD